MEKHFGKISRFSLRIQRQRPELIGSGVVVHCTVIFMASRLFTIKQHTWLEKKKKMNMEDIISASN